MANDNEVDIKVKATTDEVEPKLKAVAGAVNESFGSVKEAIEAVTQKFLAFTAVIAGGELFERVVEKTQEWNQESFKLSNTLGIVSTEASAIALALDDAGSSTETYTGSVVRLGRQLKSNEDGIQSMGIKTRDASGELLNANDVMQNAIDRLREYKVGFDRIEASQTLFGRGAGDVNALLRVTPELLEEARVKQEALGLEVGQRSVAASEAFRKSQNDVHDVMLGLQKTIGDAVIPAFTMLENLFAETGPAAVFVMKGAIGGLMTVFYLLEEGVNLAWHTIAGAVEALTITLLTFASVANRALHLDFDGAKKAWESGMDQLAQAASARLDAVNANAKKVHDSIANLFSNDTKAAGPEFQGKDNFDDPTKKKQLDSAQNEVTKAEMAARLAIVAEENKEEEAANKASLANNVISIEEYYQRRIAMQQEFFGQSIAIKQQELQQTQALEAGTQAGSVERLKYKAQEIGITGQLQVLEMQRANAALQGSLEMTAAENRYRDALNATKTKATLNNDKNELEREQQIIEQKLALHQISDAQAIQQERLLNQRIYELDRAALAQQLALLKGGSKDPQKIAQVNAQIEQLETRHQAEMTKIDTKATKERMKDWNQLFAGIQQGFSTALRGLLNGTQTLASTMKSLLGGVLDAITNTLADMAAKWITEQAAMLIMGKTTAASQIAANAGVAATAAMGSVAAIPFYGWAMAAPTGAATFAQAMAYEASASAEGGYDIPRGVNPVTQLHQNEMVLPSHLADRVRGMTDGGGSSNVSQFAPRITVQATDQRSFQRSLQRGGALDKELRRMARTFTRK